ncbi:MAG: glycosyltransferase [Muribaculaceae bacterium]|nr:glycosyltransferase [Muribaculaceae bacterium]
MKRILCITENLGSGGAERQLTGLAVLLKQQGYQVKFITYIEAQFYLHKLEEGGVDYELINGEKKWKRFFVIRSAIKKYNPDVVISFLQTASQWTILAKLSGLSFKLIVSERSATQKIGIKERLRFYLYRFADAVVANSYNERDFISKNFPSLAKKTLTITNFTDTQHFTPPQEERDFGVNKILVVGRLMPTKNTLQFLEGIKIIIDKGYSCRVRWVGNQHDNDYKDMVMEMVEKLNLSNSVEFAHQSIDIVSEYQRAAIFCLPSLFEGYPNVVCEAMSCGLPVICSNVCDNPMIVNEGENGFLFNPLSADDIATAIEKFITLPIREKITISEKNRVRAISLFGVSSFEARYVELIQDINE